MVPKTIQDVIRQVTCPQPPEGWWCSRTVGHDGPCAAREFPLTKEDLVVIANLPIADGNFI